MFSKENIKFIIEMQKSLDDRIVKEKNVVPSKEIDDKKKVAFFVEIAEFINEERSFKYWSNKAPSPKYVQLEEYIDGLHFILSIGIDVKFDFQNYSFTYMKETNTPRHYLQVINSFTDFDRNSNVDTYKTLLDSFLSIAHHLKFTEDDLISTYKLKNAINIKRQEDNY